MMFECNASYEWFPFWRLSSYEAENMVEDLLGDFEFEVQVPYLLYRNAAQEVNGIWFYNAHEIEEVADLFGRLASSSVFILKLYLWVELYLL